jgi:hypothetical protein
MGLGGGAGMGLGPGLRGEDWRVELFGVRGWVRGVGAVALARRGPSGRYR